MKDRREKKEIKKDMESKRDIINFEDYAPLDKDYNKHELAEIYKEIIKDIESCNK